MLVLTLQSGSGDVESLVYTISEMFGLYRIDVKGLVYAVRRERSGAYGET